MADERPIIKQNPEKYFNSLLNPAIKGIHPTRLDHKHLKMVGFTEKSFDFSARKTQSQATDDKNLVLKSAGLIIFRYRNHIVYVTKKKTGRPAATLVPEISPENPLVKKAADAEQGYSNAPNNQHGVQHNQDIEMVDVASQTNDGGNIGGNSNENDGNDVGNGNGNGGDDDDNDDNDDDDGEMARERCFRMDVYRFDVNVNNWNIVKKPMIRTDIMADNYECWEEVAHAIHHVYLEKGDDDDDDDNDDDGGAARKHIPIAHLKPGNCWPGYWSSFVFVTVDGLFYPANPYVTPWPNVRDLLNGFIVYRSVNA